jgi:hypothetical protein
MLWRGGLLVLQCVELIKICHELQQRASAT